MKRFMSPVFVLFVAALCVTAGCKDFTEGKEVATVREAVEVPPAATPPAGQPVAVAPGPEETPVEGAAENPAPAAAKVYKIADSTAISFEGSKTIDTHTGGFTKFDGTITMPSDDPTQATIDITIDMDSMYSDDTLLTSVLRDKDFFHVEAHPTSRFVSTKIEKAANGYAITGNLEIRGVTKSVTFTAAVNVTADKVTADAEFVVDRTLWNVGYADWKGQIIRNDVLIALAVEASAQG